MAIKKIAIRSIALMTGKVEVNAEVFTETATLDGPRTEAFLTGFSYALTENEDVKLAALKFDQVLRDRVGAALGYTPVTDALKS